MQILQRILLAVLAAGALLPHIQQHFALFHERPLDGRSTLLALPPTFGLSDWFAGRYQEALEHDVAQRFGFRNELLRLDAQVAYSVYGYAKANGVVIGSAGQLYPTSHVEAWRGDDFAGDAALEQRAQQLLRVQAGLARRGITFLLVVVPGKAAGVPEHLPVSAGTPGPRTNYRWLVRRAPELGLNLLDLAPLIAQRRRQDPYPIYAAGGMHLSLYGVHVAAGALVEKLERLCGVDLPELVVESVDWADTTSSDDGDLVRGLNLLRLPPVRLNGVPHVRYERNGKALLRVLAVGDSYWWLFVTRGITGGLFAASHFWFYYDELHVTGRAPQPRDSVSLEAELAQQDVVIVVASDANLPRLGWGFLEDVDDLVTRGAVQPRPRAAPQAD
jgi:SGNH hydrolase-like domain, acetyltransferase AlgX